MPDLGGSSRQLGDQPGEHVRIGREGRGGEVHTVTGIPRDSRMLMIHVNP